MTNLYFVFTHFKLFCNSFFLRLSWPHSRLYHDHTNRPSWISGGIQCVTFYVTYPCHAVVRRSCHAALKLMAIFIVFLYDHGDGVFVIQRSICVKRSPGSWRGWHHTKTSLQRIEKETYFCHIVYYQYMWWVKLTRKLFIAAYMKCNVCQTWYECLA